MPERVANLTGVLLERRYRLDAVLGRGSTSTVYRGRDVRLDRAIAVEVVHSSAPVSTAEFERVARIAAQLRHPAVVAVHDQCVEGDQVYLVMEFVDGGSLRDLLEERGRLAPAVALSVLGPVLSALGAAHRAGLVHGDVRPENVLIDAGGQVRVTRFGLLHALNDTGAPAPVWSPPQTGASVPDPRADVHAAGNLLHEMLTGAASPDAGQTSPAAPGVPPALHDLVRRATQRDPMQRPADASVFLQELERVGEELGLQPQPVPTPGTPPEQDRTMVIPAVATPASAAERTTPLRAAGARPRPARPRPVQRDPAEEKRRRTRRRIGIWAVIAAALVLVSGLSWWWVGTGRQTVVPAVGGQGETSAMAQVRDASLSAQVVRVLSDDVPTGTVLRTEPGTGTELRKGSSITVYVSRGRPVVPFLNAGVAVDAATKEIEGNGLKAVADEAKKAFSDTVPPGAVIAVEPRAGTQLRIGDQVTLVLSKGPAPKKAVPNVAGLTKDEAVLELQRNGLESVDGPVEFSAAVDNGRVVRTDPPPGTMLGADQKSVTLVLSNAVSMPEVRGKPIRDARAELQALGLQVTVVSPNGEDVPCAVQSVEPAQRIPAGSAVTLVGP
ncbi:PASTA domain-containing protein [Lentzea sp. NPDC059081]|uniref:Stk1 family PASTA domain-containing Ser/Thr kinase n=1 Tax=Lentzea sp. NPDC059081 TaxID=3346719 RepID=UPI0036B40C0A